MTKAASVIALFALWVTAGTLWQPLKRWGRESRDSSGDTSTTTVSSPTATPLTVGPTGISSNGSWVETVQWKQPEPLLSKQPIQGGAVFSFPNATQEEDVFREVFFGHLKRETPMCFQQGVGWVWVGETRRRHLKMKYEIQRYVSPRGLLQKGDVVRHRSDRPALLLLTPENRVYTLYHLLWVYMSGIHTAVRLRNLTQTPLSVYLQEWDGAEGRGFGVANQHYFRTLLNIYSDEVYFSDNFRAPSGSIYCHKEGYVGGMHMWYEARGRGLHGQTPDLGWLTLGGFIAKALLREYHVAIKGNANKRLLILQRRGGARVISNLEAMRAVAVGGTLPIAWDVSVFVLEEHPVAAQYAALSVADMVFQMHGSSMAWVLLIPEGRIFAEMIANVGSGASQISTEPKQVAVNPGFGTYGKLQRSCKFIHFTHLVSDLKYTPITKSCHHDGRTPPLAWKGCNLEIPLAPFAHMIGTLAEAVLKDPVAAMDLHYMSDF